MAGSGFHILDHWHGPHGVLVAHTDGVHEYRQLELEGDNDGIWPPQPNVEVKIDPDWRIDGVPESYLDPDSVTGTSPSAGRGGLGPVFKDEQNAFVRTLPNYGLGSWLRDDAAESDSRVIAFFRKRPDADRGEFDGFVQRLGRIFLEAGLLEVRVQTYSPYNPDIWLTYNVEHDNPAEREYHAAIIVAGPDRASIEEVLQSEEIAKTGPDQQKYFLAVHAYAGAIPELLAGSGIALRNGIPLVARGMWILP
ncbi:hypothetical protein ADUPG1_001025 [Aduncisulcus paluster]|uniref:Uncharacterized protein n=1 Tax=Aduncisulcus paluster TaxID=2918883 RepID=A0ABQ5KAZ2_9EUKA|nr:hypothetical protein ADUPG1_001025 [Aduncisulcus paluster]